MSLLDEPCLDVSVYAPCTCGCSRDPLRHDDKCAKVDETHPAFQAARERVKRMRLELGYPR